MGFSIGSLLSAVGKGVSAFASPLGGLAGVLTAAAPIVAAFTQPRQPSFPGPTVRARLPVFPAGAALFAGGAAVGVIAELLRLSRERTGRPASSRKIREAARVCGIALAAQTFGLSESEICTVIVSTGRRRARGISAADLRRTRSTIRKVHNIQHDLRALAPPAARRRRPAHHHH